jgi:hypothetical protein
MKKCTKSRRIPTIIITAKRYTAILFTEAIQSPVVISDEPRRLREKEEKMEFVEPQL